MKPVSRRSTAAFTAVLAACTVAVPPALAQTTLLDIIMGGPGRVEAYQQRQGQGEAASQRSSVEEMRAWERSQGAADPEPPVISGPKYYTYRPDKLEAFSIAAIDDSVTTGAIAGDASEQGETAASRVSSPVISAMGTLSVRALPEVAKAVRAHYEGGGGTVWLDGDAPNERAREALSVFTAADSYGLRSSDYTVAEPMGTGSRSQVAADRARFEIEMSVAALTYALDATRGRIDPNRISGYHDFERKSVDLASVLKVLTRTSDVESYLEWRHPRNEAFAALQRELQRLDRASEDETVVRIAEGTFLKRGTRSPEVPNIVAAIRAKGSDALKTDHALTFADYDGDTLYDGDIVALVAAFQDEKGLTSDGIVGSNTVRALSGVSNARKAESVRMSMERLRWLNDDLGTRHVMINAPAFSATYSEEGRDALTMRVVVGTKANQTYFFQDTIETVEFNPYWGVPQSIIVNEMLPKLRNDPSYLDRMGYEVTTQSGTKVASSSINWYGVGSSVPYNVRQPPGASNALGELKILFPNEHAIYMHDTPAKELFSRDTRAYSHGCVRLEDPRAMAAAVLGTTREEIGTEIAGGRNKGVEVAGEIPVYVAYFTAWPGASGEVEYFADVYDRDDHLRRAIEATNSARHAES